MHFVEYVDYLSTDYKKRFLLHLVYRRLSKCVTQAYHAIEIFKVAVTSYYGLKDTELEITCITMYRMVQIRPFLGVFPISQRDR